MTVYSITPTILDINIVKHSKWRNELTDDSVAQNKKQYTLQKLSTLYFLRCEFRLLT